MDQNSQPRKDSSLTSLLFKPLPEREFLTIKTLINENPDVEILFKVLRGLQDFHVVKAGEIALESMDFPGKNEESKEQILLANFYGQMLIKLKEIADGKIELVTL